MAFPEVVAKLCEAAAKPENRGYSDNGDPVLKQAAARYMDSVFGVKGINPEAEVVHSIGSKAALSILPAAFINPGDFVLMTVPGYPVFGTHARYYGGLVYNLKLTAENNFLPDLNSIPNEALRKAESARFELSRTIPPVAAPLRNFLRALLSLPKKITSSSSMMPLTRD